MINKRLLSSFLLLLHLFMISLASAQGNSELGALPDEDAFPKVEFVLVLRVTLAYQGLADQIINISEGRK